MTLLLLRMEWFNFQHFRKMKIMLRIKCFVEPEPEQCCCEERKKYEKYHFQVCSD